MKIRQLAFTSLVFIFSISTASAAEVSSVVSDNGSIVISGSNFGSGASISEWVGDNIENGPVGGVFSKPKWAVDAQGDSFQSAVYTDTKAHSGTKALLCELPNPSQYNSGITFNNGSRFNEVYISYWVHFDHVNSAGQWKMWRIRPANNYTDMSGEIMASDWYTATGENHQNYVYIFCDPASYSQCYPGGVADLFGDAGDLLPVDVWVRVEIHAIGSSADGVADGSLYFSWQIPGNAPRVLRDYDNNIITRLPGSEQWQYFMLQNYWGNIFEGTGTEEKFYFDDIFIQPGSPARVEIGNNAVFANCTHREIQPATAWSPTSITANLNQGSMPDGTAYLFVIDENGVASDGYPITLGGETPTYDLPTITIQDASTSTSSGTITGTYTVDSELSAGLCTWSHSSGSVTGFATVMLGVVSGTVAGLPVGETTVSFSLLDSENQQATDTSIFTRIESSHHSIGKGFYIKGINIK